MISVSPVDGTPSLRRKQEKGVSDEVDICDEEERGAYFDGIL
jgi:hypothetical protein